MRGSAKDTKEVVFKIDPGWPNLAELILGRVRTARDSDFEIVHQGGQVYLVTETENWAF